MYGIPVGTNLEFLRGQTLIQVCFGAHDLIFNFSGDISISVFSSIGLGLTNGPTQKYTDFPAPAETVLGLINDSIAHVAWAQEGLLTLDFENGVRVELYDDSKQFESYTIQSAKGLLVV